MEKAVCMNIRQVRKIVESRGMTLEDHGHSYELKNKQGGETGAYYPKDKPGLRQLKQIASTLQKGAQ